MTKKHTLNLEKFWVYRWQWRDLVVFAAALSRLNVAYWTPLQRRCARCTGAILTVYRDGVTLFNGWKLHIRRLFLCRDICSQTSLVAKTMYITGVQQQVPASRRIAAAAAAAQRPVRYDRRGFACSTLCSTLWPIACTIGWQLSYNVCDWLPVKQRVEYYIVARRPVLRGCWPTCMEQTSTTASRVHSPDTFKRQLKKTFLYNHAFNLHC